MRPSVFLFRSRFARTLQCSFDFEKTGCKSIVVSDEDKTVGKPKFTTVKHSQTKTNMVPQAGAVAKRQPKPSLQGLSRVDILVSSSFQVKGTHLSDEAALIENLRKTPMLG